MQAELLEKIQSGTAQVAVVGLGYVGLPLALAAVEKGYRVLGLEISQSKLDRLARFDSYVEAISTEDLKERLSPEGLTLTSDYARISEVDVVVICVPTPLTRYRTPELKYVEDAVQQLEKHLAGSTLVILESTTYPGTTEEVIVPLLTSNGLVLGQDVFVGFSPEREDPGNAKFDTKTIPKVVSGIDAASLDLVAAFYGAFLEQIVTVSSPAVAEACKITENVFRAVNIALVNELKMIYERMDIDVWEVIDAAATKPFGYMPFYPGPGLGGHCIPVDPFYLSWKAREHGMSAQFIELAGEINMMMPDFVISRLRETVDVECGLSLSRSRVLCIGAAYKKNVSDVRESPSIEIIERLHEAGANVTCHDPHVTSLDGFRNGSSLAGRPTIAAKDIKSTDYDIVIILTDHDDVDYASLAAMGLPIVDTRNVLDRKNIAMSAKVIKA